MRVDATNYDEATALIVRWARNAESRCVYEVPVNAVMESYDHPDFQAAINAADLVTPGGMPIVWTMRLLGIRGQPRVYGPELMLRVCQAAARDNIPVGFYGGTERALQALQKVLIQRYPGLNIQFAFSPPFRGLTAEEEGQIATAIRGSGCRLLFVGLGCPKQERWMARHRGQLPAVMLGVGAAFDFISGEKRQAPAWMQALGLEWLFRWSTEPRRLFYRYACQNPRFLVLVAIQLLRAGFHRPSART
jgi:N-acetylglucosaminyldiphosphoundecaprenol N-acetyl-beta-D-mannosaminyltransferase